MEQINYQLKCLNHSDLEVCQHISYYKHIQKMASTRLPPIADNSVSFIDFRHRRVYI